MKKLRLHLDALHVESFGFFIGHLLRWIDEERTGAPRAGADLTRTRFISR